MVPVKPPPRENDMGVVPQPPPRIKGEFGRVEPKTGSRFYGAWQCEYCKKPNQNVDRCTECGAPRTAIGIELPKSERRDWWNTLPRELVELQHWFNREKHLLAHKYAAVDSNGHFVIERGMYTFKNESNRRKFNEEAEELGRRYQDKKRALEKGKLVIIGPDKPIP